MSTAADFDLPKFVMHGSRSVVTLARQPEFFARQVQALEEAVVNQPALAIDIAKALVETACKTVMNDRSKAIDNGWDTPRLMKEALGCLSLVPDALQNSQAVQDSLRRTAGSLQGAVQGICEVRNKEGFASHGRDAYVLTLDSVHAEFVARSADAVISFLYKSHFRDQKQHRLMAYGDNEELNHWLDEQNAEVVIIYPADETVTLSYTASEVLFNVDLGAYQNALAEQQNAQAQRVPNAAEE